MQNYKSKYNADKNISKAQWLTEQICERIAAKEKKTLLPKFWNDPKWNKIFRRQISAANTLLAKHDIVDIMAALKHPKGKWITSLGAYKQINSLIENVIKIKKSSEEELVDHDMGGNDYNWEQFGLDEIAERSSKRNLWEEMNG